MFLRSKVTVGIVCVYAVAALLSGCGSTEASAPKDIVKVEENAGDTSAASEENASEETAAPEGSADETSRLRIRFWSTRTGSRLQRRNM